MSVDSEGFRMGLVIFAKNTQKVSAFYEQTLELQLVEGAASHRVLHGPHLELVIHAIPKKIAQSIEICEPPQAREQIALKPAFAVRDLRAVRAAAEKAGGYLKPDSAAWDIRGSRVLDGWDPEGNVVQFKQRLERER